MKKRKFDTLNETIVRCRLCPRLVKYREGVEKRASFTQETYWRKPVPGFGDPKAQIILLGLAPSAHGGNRTGRIFTGDESGKFLMEALYEVGLANQPTSESRDDGLRLINCYMTAIVKCVPPKNLPLKQECNNCQPYWENELALLPNTQSIVALGEMAFRSCVRHLSRETKGVKFQHGKKYYLPPYTLYASYHPSPQNTYTKKLTKSMLIKLFNKVQLDL